MSLFVKLASLCAVVVGGSLLTMWLLFSGDVVLAGLAAVGATSLAVGAIMLIARETHPAKRTPQ